LFRFKNILKHREDTTMFPRRDDGLGAFRGLFNAAPFIILIWLLIGYLGMQACDTEPPTLLEKGEER
jgi:hypothetical protein